MAMESEERFKELVKRALDEWDVGKAMNFAMEAWRVAGYGAHWQTGVHFLEGALSASYARKAHGADS
jgi:hypothetical protein